MTFGIKQITLWVLTALGTLATLFFPACKPSLRELSVSGWIAADVDIAVVYARAAIGDEIIGLYVYDRLPGVYRPDDKGWTGGGAVFPVKEFPDHIFVSWRLPPPGESDYERCARRTGRPLDCAEKFPFVERPPEVVESGQLVGPFKVPINLSPKAKELMKRPGSYNRLSVGVTYGLEPPKLRWILYGDPEKGKVDLPPHNELARGGDW